MDLLKNQTKINEQPQSPQKSSTLQSTTHSIESSKQQKNKDTDERINVIDQLLPQTQCGLCQYEACKPYATAIVKQGEAINHCLPGGIDTLIALAEATKQDPTPYIPPFQEQPHPSRVAIIQESTCIGCTKCIQVCPTDAIIGAGKQMHTVIADACTGCERCLAPCPVDCIDITLLPEPTPQQKKIKANNWRNRYENRQKRLKENAHKAHQKHELAKLPQNNRENIITARKAAIEAAVSRARSRKKKTDYVS